MHPAAQASVRVALRFTARRPVRFFCRRAKTRLAASKTLARISNGTPLPLFCLSRPRASSSTPLSRLSLRAFSLKPRGPFGISAPHARRQRSHCEGRRVIVAWHGSCKFSPLFPTAKPKACDELITGPQWVFNYNNTDGARPRVTGVADQRPGRRRTAGGGRGIFGGPRRARGAPEQKLQNSILVVTNVSVNWLSRETSTRRPRERAQARLGLQWAAKLRKNLANIIS